MLRTLICMLEYRGYEVATRTFPIHASKEDQSIVVEYRRDMGLALMRDFVIDMRGLPCILVTAGLISKEALALAEASSVEHFTVAETMVNPSLYNPPFEICAPVDNYCLIRADDPMIRFLGAKVGDFVKITSDVRGIQVLYRRVVKNP